MVKYLIVVQDITDYTEKKEFNPACVYQCDNIAKVITILTEELECNLKIEQLTKLFKNRVLYVEAENELITLIEQE